MTLRKKALFVAQNTHLVKWACRRTHCESPVVPVQGEDIWVEVYPGRFPRVVVYPYAKSFRVFLPWSWARTVLDHCRAERIRKLEMKRKLFALAMKTGVRTRKKR